MNFKQLVRNCVPPVLCNAVHRLLRAIKKRPSIPGLGLVKEYQIGPYCLALPVDHALPDYQRIWKLYDVPLKIVVECLLELNGALTAIDIGANIGDTAATLGSDARVSVLCIEGDPLYLPFLEYNSRIIGPHVVVERSYVGDKPTQISSTNLIRHGGTTESHVAFHQDSMQGDILVQRLEAIALRHTKFSSPDLIKIDTDGFDFTIIQSHLEFFAANQPVLFFEYMVESKQLYDDSLTCLKGLIDAGYTRFFVFDNFGNLISSDASIDMLRELNQYLLSNLAFGRAVNYFDVLAIADPQIAKVISERFSQQIWAEVTGD